MVDCERVNAWPTHDEHVPSTFIAGYRMKQFSETMISFALCKGVEYAKSYSIITKFGKTFDNK